MSQKSYPQTFATTSNSFTMQQYEALYKASLENPEKFWGSQGHLIEWIKPYSQVKDTSFLKKDFRVRWYADGQLNVSANCVDRHLATKGDKTALIWVGNDPGQLKKLSYTQLAAEVQVFANVLKKLGVQKGDRVAIYLPMILEGVIAMLACARIGAIHSVVFGGFSAGALAARLDDCEACLLITADGSRRGDKPIDLKSVADQALELSAKKTVRTCLVVHHAENGCVMQSGRDVWYHDARQGVSNDCVPEVMNAEDPLFILYTSGSTGKPKGVLHTSGGYLVYAAMTFKHVFNYQDTDIHWCTADIGWITGHSYVVYGPLSQGATVVIYEGVPLYPTPARFWEIIDALGVTIFYTAPTAIRSLMKEGDTHLSSTRRDSLRVLGSVGEPLNEEAWLWYYHQVGKERCPLVDTWWQTETGGIVLTPLAGVGNLKPGSVSRPFFGIKPVLLDPAGAIVEGVGSGSLALADSWPGQMRGVYNAPERFFETYFMAFPGYYTSGDGARRDEDGDYWITGRVDDVIKVSGHRIGTAEVESALNLHPVVAESAVVGIPDEVKGQSILAFVILKQGVQPPEHLTKELVHLVREHVGALAKPERIVVVPGLPKTRSGKIMRRILRKIGEGNIADIGDTSTLAESDVIEKILAVIR